MRSHYERFRSQEKFSCGRSAGSAEAGSSPLAASGHKWHSRRAGLGHRRQCLGNEAYGQIGVVQCSTTHHGLVLDLSCNSSVLRSCFVPCLPARRLADADGCGCRHGPPEIKFPQSWQIAAGSSTSCLAISRDPRPTPPAPPGTRPRAPAPWSPSPPDPLA